MEIILQRQRSRNYRGWDYYRYRVTIPTQIAAELKLRGGERLDVSMVKGGILIRRVSES